MRFQITIAAAVAAVLASAAANAANIDIYISGASAQKNFWYDDLRFLADCTGGGGGHGAVPVGAKWNGAVTAPFTTAPDLSFITCTAGTAPGSSHIPAGSVVTFHYSAELGTVWGIANMLGFSGVAGYPTKHIFLTNGPGCGPLSAFNPATGKFANAASVCDGAANQYALYTSGKGDSGNDVITGGNPAEIVYVQPDVAVADAEPALWELPDNWPTANTDDLGNSPAAAPLYNAIGGVPTVANIGAIKITKANGDGRINGQVFVPIVNGVPGGNPSNLSSQTLQSIFQGQYTDWKQVPEVGVAGAITVCRRDHGSGTQAFASVIFTGTECGLTNTSTFIPEPPNGTAILNGGTSALKACVNGHAGAIGMLSLTGNLPQAADTYVIPTVDGVQGNAHNAAAGYYKYASETFAINTSVANTLVVKDMLTDAGQATRLGSSLGNETVAVGANKQFTAVGNPVGAYALPGSAGNPASTLALMNVSPGIPQALTNHSGNSCSVATGGNAT